MQKNKGHVSQERETATLAGGCFWCLEAVFMELRGVEKVISGYSGGAVEKPTYREVCTGTTGHAEVVQILFNPGEISFKDILEVFFTIHDPTTLNRQGADVGTQYRSAIFYHSKEQKEIAEDVIREFDRSHTWEDPIVTEVSPFSHFYPAEDEHKDYYDKHSHEPYCRLVIAPKIAKLRKHFTDQLK
jgi:peptide-methionine (S)-S-oxide reductase